MKIVVIGDWTHCSRGVLWKSIVRDLKHEYDEYRLADSVAPPGARQASPPDSHAEPPSEQPFLAVAFLRRLEDAQVLIINWDAINGDPEFGADFTLRWFEHHRGEILAWVDEGNLLIIEGQAILGVPCQRAYDSILGRREVLLSGPQDALNARLERRRAGRQCRVTRLAQRDRSFCSDLEELSVKAYPSHVDMFPAPADEHVWPRLIEQDWAILYRGWFRWSPSIRRRFRWSILARTHARRERDRPTLLATRHGQGTIIVTTMLLASSGQGELVEALFRSVNNNAAVPQRPFVLDLIADKLIPAVMSAAAGLVAAVVFARNVGMQVAVTAVVTVLTFVVLQVWLPFGGWRFKRAIKKRIAIH